MKSKSLTGNFNKLCKDTRRHYNNLLEDFKEGEIHDFRLGIKKMRALIRLVNSGAEKPLKLGKRIREFYSITGQIRSLQLHRESIIQLCQNQKVQEPRVYLALIKNQLKIHQEAGRRSARKLSWNQWQDKCAERLPHRVDKEMVRIFLRQKHIILAGLMSQNLNNDEVLHSIRKNCKDLLYVLEMIEHDWPPGFPIYFTGKEELEALTGFLGDFHDYCIHLQLFQNLFIPEVVSEEEKSSLLVYQQHWNECKEKLKREILESWQFSNYASNVKTVNASEVEEQDEKDLPPE
jgi:CHAD domain-containing protein